MFPLWLNRSHPCTDYNMLYVVRVRVTSLPHGLDLENGVWLKNARHANTLASMLGARLALLPGLEVEPVHANEVFVRTTPTFVNALRDAGHLFLDFAIANGASAGQRQQHRRLRLVTAWSSTTESCELLLADATRISHRIATATRAIPPSKL